MAKKIFLLITTLFIGLTVVFYGHQFGIFKEQLSQRKTSKITEKKDSPNNEKKQQPELPGKTKDWNLLLVNEENEIKEEPTDLQELPNGYKVDKRIYSEYMALTEAALKAGFELTVISAYRSVEEQKQVVATDIAEYEAQGHSKEEATDLAMKYLTEPGLSEHHTGLALDVLDTDWYNQGNMLDEAFGNTEAGKWLAENVCHYGFVIRYQKGKEKLTGINYEPWHIRYVGKENAEYMYKNDLVLEEYINQLKSR